jgi:hypothetical protein
MKDLRDLADRAWRNGDYGVGAALDRAADAVDEADKLAAQARAHRIAATAHLDRLQARVRDLTDDHHQERALTAARVRNVHLTGQILAFLADQSPLPVSTGVIHGALQPACEGWPHTRCWESHVDYSAVYRILNQLAARAEVEKWPPSDDRRSCLWRRLTGRVQI